MKLTDLKGVDALAFIQKKFDEYEARIAKLEAKKQIKKQINKSFEDYKKEWKQIYHWVDVDRELSKMDGWLKLHPERKKTPRFCVNWFNKYFGEKPLDKPKDKPIHPSQVTYKKKEIEPDLEWDKKVAMFKLLPEEEQKNRLEKAKASFKNQLFAIPQAVLCKAIQEL